MYNFHENIKKMTYQEFLNFFGFNIYYKLSFFNCIPDDVTTIIVHKDENYNEKKQLGVSDIGFSGSIYDVNYPSMDKLIDEAYKVLLKEYSNKKTFIFNHKNNFSEELNDLKNININTEKGKTEFKDNYLIISNEISNEDIMIHLPFQKGDKLYLLKHNFINDLINGYEEIEIDDIYCHYNYTDYNNSSSNYLNLNENFVFNPTYLYKQGDQYFKFQVNSDGTIKHEFNNWSLFKTKQEAINKQQEIAKIINEKINSIVF